MLGIGSVGRLSGNSKLMAAAKLETLLRRAKELEQRELARVTEGWKQGRRVKNGVVYILRKKVRTKVW